MTARRSGLRGITPRARASVLVDAKPVRIDVVPADQPMEGLAQDASSARRFSNIAAVPMERREQVVARGPRAGEREVLVIRQHREVCAVGCAGALVQPRAIVDRSELVEQLWSWRLADANDRRVRRQLREANRLHD